MNAESEYLFMVKYLNIFIFLFNGGRVGVKIEPKKESFFFWYSFMTSKYDYVQGLLFRIFVFRLSEATLDMS